MSAFNFLNSFIVQEPYEDIVAANDNEPDFSAARKRFFEDMAYLTECPEHEKPAFLKNIPAWDPEAWSSKENNCYNFALNRDTKDYLQPGGLAGMPPPHPAIRFEDYKKDLIYKTEKDGVRSLKTSFLECAPDEMPIALFAGLFDTFFGIISDGHCFGPKYITTCTGKTTYVWTEKPGEGAPDLCPSRAKLGYVDIFEAAAKRGYTDFCGFMAAPASLQKPPPPTYAR